jgi:hypothetical protein
MPSDGVAEYIASLGRQPRQAQTEVFDGERVAEFRQRYDADANRIQPADVVHLARHFGVSPLAVIYRLRKLGLLSRAERDALVTLDREDGFLELGALLGLHEAAVGHDEPLADQHRFLALVTEALRRSLISWGRAYEFADLAGMKASRFEQLADAMQIQPEPPDALVPADLV